MGDRLTLETAVGRLEDYLQRADLPLWDGVAGAVRDIAEAAADDAVRAYRERLPEVSAVSSEDWHAIALGAVGRCNAHSRNLSAVRDALSSVIDIGENDAELAGFIDQLAERAPMEERTRADWGDALGLDPNGAPYSTDALLAEMERAVSERGPTEGASDADALAEIMGMGDEVEHNMGDLLAALHLRLNRAGEGVDVRGLFERVSYIADMVPTDRIREDLLTAIADAKAGGVLGDIGIRVGERPPTGEASPTGNAAGDIALQIAPVLTRQRARAEAKLGTLIGAVEAELNRDENGVYELMGEHTMILRAALDAAKGDAPTECDCGPGARYDEVNQVCLECRRPLGEDAPTASSSPPTPEPDIGNNGEWPSWCGIGPDEGRRHEAEIGPDGVERCRHCLVERGVSRNPSPPTPDPQVPDSPGRWLCAGVEVGVEWSTGGRLMWRDPVLGVWKHVQGDATWGGRCTRDAPGTKDDDIAEAMRDRRSAGESVASIARDFNLETSDVEAVTGLRAKVEHLIAKLAPSTGVGGEWNPTPQGMRAALIEALAT